MSKRTEALEAVIHTRDRCTKDVYSLKQTAAGNWYVQKNGQDVGDSPKYANKSDAVKSAHRAVSVDPDNREYREVFAIGKVDFSQQAYRGYLIRTDALNNTMWVEKNGQPVCSIPADKSWVWARGIVDDLLRDKP